MRVARFLISSPVGSPLIDAASAAGVLRGDEFLAIRDPFLSILRTPGGRRWWGLHQSQVPLSLNDYLSSVIDDPSITRPPMHEHFPWLFLVEEQQNALRGDAASLSIR